MKKIVQHGHNPKKVIRRFVCRNCGCMFDADSDDYFVSRHSNVCESVCPECGDRSFSYPDVYKR